MHGDIFYECAEQVFTQCVQLLCVICKGLSFASCIRERAWCNRFHVGVCQKGIYFWLLRAMPRSRSLLVYHRVILFGARSGWIAVTWSSRVRIVDNISALAVLLGFWDLVSFRRSVRSQMRWRSLISLGKVGTSDLMPEERRRPLGGCCCCESDSSSSQSSFSALSTWFSGMPLRRMLRDETGSLWRANGAKM